MILEKIMSTLKFMNPFFEKPLLKKNIIFLVKRIYLQHFLVIYYKLVLEFQIVTKLAS